MRARGRYVGFIPSAMLPDAGSTWMAYFIEYIEDVPAAFGELAPQAQGVVAFHEKEAVHAAFVFLERHVAAAEVVGAGLRIARIDPEVFGAEFVLQLRGSLIHLIHVLRTLTLRRIAVSVDAHIGEYYEQRRDGGKLGPVLPARRSPIRSADSAAKRAAIQQAAVTDG